MDLELTGKTAIVTGGSRGIGKAAARQLALEGVDVAIAARTKDALEATAEELRKETGRRVLPIVVDTGQDESVQNMVRQAVEAFGHIDILVNCAAQPGGQGPVPSLEQITNDHFWSDMNVKVMGYLRCAREVAPYMKQQGWGRIISISGLAARQSGNTVGSMRNVSVAALTKNLADELGPFGINATVVHPGLTRTEKTNEETAQRMAGANSSRKIVDARDIANIVAFLASPKAFPINGDAIAAGGGVGRGIYY